MGETEFEIFAVLINLILLVFIVGIIVFFLKYHKRKLISEKEKALLNEQHAQDMLQSKLEIQQQTMQDIGREIHDNVGQLLTVASLYAHQLVYDNKFPEHNKQAAEIGNIVDLSLAELRNLSKNLTSEKAEMHELIELLHNECTRINALNICKVTCNHNELNFTIPMAVKNMMVRIAQEFIQNSLKHAGCRNIVLDFNHTTAGLAVRMHDDGRGFEKNAAPGNSTGIGLSNMKKRAELMGATFSHSSKLNEGTFLDIFIPAEKLKYY